ncbi:nucleoside diphosphate kinase regulator [Xanthomonas sp. XNM01]|uniref:nucleoside diphosphate kinase regulator n=1 Tax=Xanthomonas sp. XNM01 TaxID=2769289 RepID=UPI00177EB9EF|nr:nucleoside diphosphate kinase regulator [Xanthomonas sp. XNM01]
MSNQPTSGLPPSIIVSSRDLARLEALLDSPALSRHPAALALMDELNRADVLPPERVPADVVTMHSQVECEDTSSGERHVLTLVYPNEADVDRHRVSILAPVGSALIGLSVGQSIVWDAPGGRPLNLTVRSVRYQPEAAGDLHR